MGKNIHLHVHRSPGAGRRTVDGDSAIVADLKYELSYWKQQRAKAKTGRDRLDAEAEISKYERLIERAIKTGDSCSCGGSCDKCAHAGTRDSDVYEIEFDKRPGKVIRLANDSDAAVEAVAKQLGLWKGKNEPFPSFSLFRNGKEIGGG